MKEYKHTYPFPTGYALPVNFKGFRFEELKEFFGQFETPQECYRALFAYEGDNWVISHVCGKRTAYLSLVESGKDVTWDQVCKA